MARYAGAHTAGLPPDAPALPCEWREGSGIAFACERQAAGLPADPLLGTLHRHHPRMHDGRSVDAAETARIDRVLTKPGARLPTAPMVETGEAGAALARTRETPAERRARIATLVPAEKVRGWVPAWRRAEPEAGSVRACPGLDPGAVGSRQSEGGGSVASVVPSDLPERSGAGPDARETAADATCRAVTAGETAPLSKPRHSRVRVGGRQEPGSLPCDKPEPAARSGSRSGPEGGSDNLRERPVREPPQSVGRETTPADEDVTAGETAPSFAPAGVRSSEKTSCLSVSPAATPGRQQRDTPGVTAGRDPHPRPEPAAPARPWPTEIRAIVTAHYGVATEDLVAGSRKSRVVLARQVAMWLARTLTPASLSAIGRPLGGRDHTTVLHGIATVETRRGLDDAFAAELDRLERLALATAAARAEALR